MPADARRRARRRGRRTGGSSRSARSWRHRARGDRRARAARPARRRRRPRALQRARPRRVGGLRHRHRARWRPAATTCAIDMPLNALPPTIDGAAFDAKVARPRGRRAIDFALWGGLVPGDLDRLDELAARGVVGFKAFMSASGVDEFPAADDLTLLRGHGARRRARPARRRARRERRRSRGGLARRAVAEGRHRRCATTSPRGRSSPSSRRSRRAIALRRARRAARCTSSTSRAAAASRSSPRPRPRRRRHVRDLPALPRAHDEDVERLGAVAKCAPPLRPAAEREALWRRSGRGRRHRRLRPLAVARGAQAGRRLFAVWGGISGAQTLPALLSTPGVAPGAPRGRLLAARAGAALRPGAGQGCARAGPTPTWRSSTRPHWTLRARRPARPPPAQPVRGPPAPRPRRAHDPARADGRARDGRVVGEPCGTRGAPLLGLRAVSALHEAIAELARFNDDPEAGGITREVYTPTYARAVEWVAGWMREAGLEMRLDAVGNLFGRWAGGEPDARGRAHRLAHRHHAERRRLRRRARRARRDRGDAALRAAGVAPRRAIEVVAWAGEEPRFGTGCVGSRARGRRAGARRPRPARRPRRHEHGRTRCARRASSPTAWPTRASIPRRCTRSSSCTSSRASSSRPRRADRRRHRDRRAARLPPDPARRRHPRGRDADGPAPRRAGRRGRGDGALERRRARRPAARRSAPSACCARARARSTSCPARSSSTSTCATATRPPASKVVDGDRAAAREIAQRRGLEVEVTPIVRGRAGRPARRVVGGRGGVRRARARRAPDDQRRLPRRDDHGPPRARRDDLRPSAGGVSHHPDEYTAPEDLDRGVRCSPATLARPAGLAAAPGRALRRSAWRLVHTATLTVYAVATSRGRAWSRGRAYLGDRGTRGSPATAARPAEGHGRPPVAASSPSPRDRARQGSG